MKVTRVILAATDNPLYYQFWNPLSKIYLKQFGIKPTLIWLGKKEDIQRLELNDFYGEILVQEPHPKYPIGWQSAWAIFYFTRLYPEDTFCTMGIDQIPLGPWLIRDIPSTIPDDRYLMLVDDGYAPSHWVQEGGTSPTSFHFMTSAIASEVFKFEFSFHEEIEKIMNSGIKPYYAEGGIYWGLDESYASHKLREYVARGGKVKNKSMFKEICDRRIECCRINEAPYDENTLKGGWYGDAHLCRPFSDHKLYIEKMLDLIPIVL